MILEALTTQFVPMHDPVKAAGAITLTVRRKKDYPKRNGTFSIYIDCYQKKRRKKYFLSMEASADDFNDETGRFKNKAVNAKAYNLLIEQKLAQMNKIMINYELANRPLTVAYLIEEMHSPTYRMDFYTYALRKLEEEKDSIASGTYRHQKGQINKLKDILPDITFAEIDKECINTIIKYCKKKKNTFNTTYNTLRCFKKYLHKSWKDGIMTQLHWQEIKTPYRKTKFQFLRKEEIQILNEYLENKFTQSHHKNVLKQFLFCCFTGLRWSDMQAITRENIMGDILLFSAKKTNKIQRIKMIPSALRYINDDGDLFDKLISNQKTNEALRQISKACELDKKLNFHISRHTFATQYILNGGDVVSLQQLLGHSNIRETMTYAHAVQSMVDEGMDQLENILKS